MFDALLVACRATLSYNRREIGNVGELHNLEDKPWPTSKAIALALMN